MFISLISTLLTFSSPPKIPRNFISKAANSSSCLRRSTFAEQFCLLFICFSSRSNFTFSFNFFASNSFSIARLVSFLAFLSISSPFCLTSFASKYFFCFISASWIFRISQSSFALAFGFLFCARDRVALHSFSKSSKQALFFSFNFSDSARKLSFICSRSCSCRFFKSNSLSFLTSIASTITF